MPAQLRGLAHPESLSDARIRELLHGASDRDLTTFVWADTLVDPRVRAVVVEEALVRRGPKGDGEMTTVLLALSGYDDPAGEAARNALGLKRPPTPR